MVVAEGSFLLEEVGSAATVLGAAATLVAVVIMDGMNLETRVSTQGEVGVRVDAVERVISVIIMEEAGVKVAGAVVLLLLKHWWKELMDRQFFGDTNEAHFFFLFFSPSFFPLFLMDK